MIDNIQTLLALADTGTMTRASNRLHISQSAVSRRIKTLEAAVGKKLIEKSGRQVVFTQQGARLLERMRPLVADILDAVAEEVSEAKGVIELALAEPLTYSFGAKLLMNIQEAYPNLKLIIHSHPVRQGLERVSAGEYMLALAPGLAEVSPDLIARPLAEEPMVIIPSRLQKFKYPKKGYFDIITTDLTQGTWVSIGSELRNFFSKRGVKLRVVREIQTYASVLKLAEAGFGHGLVPLGVPKAFNIPEDKIIRLPKPGVTRTISIIAKKSTFSRTIVKTFENAVRANLNLDYLTLVDPT